MIRMINREIWLLTGFKNQEKDRNVFAVSWASNFAWEEVFSLSKSQWCRDGF